MTDDLDLVENSNFNVQIELIDEWRLYTISSRVLWIMWKRAKIISIKINDALSLNTVANKKFPIVNVGVNYFSWKYIYDLKMPAVPLPKLLIK